MKRKIIFLSSIMAIFSYSTVAQIKMNSSGNVSIGNTTPSSSYILRTYGNILFDGLSNLSMCDLKMDNAGEGFPTLHPSFSDVGELGTSTNPFLKIYSTNPLQVSDKRQKENLRSITGALDCILNLKGWKYDLRLEILNDGTLSNNDELYKYLDTYRKDKLGLMAQDVKEVLPEAVEYDSINDVYSIYYNHLIPVLIEAMKEQQIMIKDLKNEIMALKSESSDNLKSEILTTDDNLSGHSDKPILFQNRPNPFNENTEIRFYLPATVNDARIYLYSMQGNQLKSIVINKRGQGNELIHGSDLPPGMYMYTLVVNGFEVDTKRMILFD